MKIQLSQQNTQATNQVHQKLLDASEKFYTNEELSSLSKDQQKLIFDILKEVDLSTPILRKNLIQRIEANPKITRVVHLAISLREKIQDDYLVFNQDLIQSSIDALEYIQIEGDDLLMRDCWAKYSTLFDKKTLESLGTDNLYQLTSLLYKTAGLNLPKHQTVVEALPEQGKKYHQVLQLGLSDFWKEICKIHKNPSEECFIALSHYISANKLPFSAVQSLLSSNDNLSQLLPHLRFGDFKNVDDEIIIRTLQKATKLEYVIISSPSITTLPELPACKTLICSHCYSLIRVPELPLCQKLECSHCFSLATLPNLPLCQKLDCSHCRLLTRVSEIPLCQKLDCSHCDVLINIPAIPFCQELDCSHCSFLSTLPELPLCQKLNCLACSSLRTIPALSLCQELSCGRCSSLITLPELPLCQKLNCFGCGSLRTLPELPSCQELSCYNCFSLSRLPDLSLCQNLNCKNCYTLSAIPELPLCQKLDCSHCRALQALPQALPACEELNCEGCLLLRNEMPEIPSPAQVYIGDSTPLEFTKIYVDLHEISSNPRKLLLELGTHLLQNKPFPNIYYQLQGELSAAIDIGGVRRDFISRLMETLFAESSMSGKLVMNHQKLPRLTDKEDIDCYRTIGRIFALCYPENSYFKTGTLFSTDVYQKIAFLAHPSLAALDITSDNNNLSTYLHYRSFSGFLRLIDRSDNNIRDIEESILTSAYIFIGMHGDALEARSYFENQKNRELLKKEIMEAAESDTQFHAIRIIVQEIRNKIGAESWSNLYQETSDNIQKRIEGELSKEALLNKLDWEETPSSSSIDPQLKEKTKGYLKSWIERASIKDLTKFVRAVTSNNTLGPNQLKIELFNRGPEFVPVTHTCFFTLELSAEYLDQKTFDKKINLLLTEGMAGSGFQIA